MAPQFFKLVELAHFRPEQMDNDIAGIDQYPVAAGPPFDLSAAQSNIPKHSKKMIGHRADLTSRSSGRDHHIIRNAGFSGEIDNDDIRCLIFFEQLLD